VDYKLFYLIARERAVGKTSRNRFILDWAHEQKRQGITPPAGPWEEWEDRRNYERRKD
jgi:hypothetical protein